MPEICAFVDPKTARQISRSAAIRDVLSHQGAVLALSEFLDEAENGLNPVIEATDLESDDDSILLRAIIDETTEERITTLIGESGFTPDDVLASAVRLMVAGDKQIALEQNNLELDQAEAEREALIEYLRQAGGQIS